MTLSQWLPKTIGNTDTYIIIHNSSNILWLEFTTTRGTILKGCRVRKAADSSCGSFFTWKTDSILIFLEHTSRHFQVHGFTLVKSLVLAYVFSTVLNGGTHDVPMWSCNFRNGTIVEPFSIVVLKGTVCIACKSHVISCKYSNPWWGQGHNRFLSGLKKVKLWR